MAKETKIEKIENNEKVSKKPLVISLISTLIAVLIICTTLLLVFSNKTTSEKHNMFVKDLVAVKLDNGWGYINYKGEVEIEGQFGEAYPFAENGLALVLLDGYYGFINTEGKYVINPVYSQATSFDDESDMAVVKRNSKYGYINSKGEEIIPCQFEEAYQFSYNLALVKIGGKYGFINEKGKFTINPIYDDAETFVNKKLTVVGKDLNGTMAYACISNKGELLTDFMLTEVYMSENYVITYDGVYYGFCELDLVPLFKTDYQIAGFPIYLNSFESLEEELIPFRNLETYKYGYLNMQGQVVIEPQYDIIGDFCDGLAMVKFDNKYGFINNKDKLIVNNIYDVVNNYNEGYAVVGIDNDGEIQYGIIDNNGKVVVETKYYAIGNVNNGLSYFTTFDSELVGYINMNNEIVIPQIYSTINKNLMGYDFTDDGYVVVKQDAHYGVLDKLGNYIINPYLLGVNY